MTAAGFQVVTNIFGDPAYNYQNPLRREQLQPSISFAYTGRSISTLSDTGLTPGQDVFGLLYTPDLDTADPCYNATQPSVLKATRQANLPNRDFSLIALAPWISPACTLSYLAAAALDPCNGFFFYQLNNNTDVPPPSSDSTWNLGDSGQWKRTYRFPVFAIPGATGALLMQASGQYSGNLTTVPYGSQLATTYDPRDYVRLITTVGIMSASSLPSLWVFLLIVLGILLGIIFATSIFMHCLQRRRRSRLRQRVVTGELDLEALGIQRLTVPQHLLDDMPLFEYGSGKSLKDDEIRKHNPGSYKKEDANVTPTEVTPSKNVNHSASASVLTGPTLATRSAFSNHMNQPTCAICLDDFSAATADTPGSAVRQLPCHHIFHPECVDNFLRENSSLCPMCKHSALPVGYCPRTITNAMVRRERIVRRMRERADAGEHVDELYSTRRPGGIFGPVRRFFSPRPAQPSLEGHAMAEVTQPEPVSPAPAAAVACPPEGTNRREWARQRALAMIGRRPLVAEQETENPSRWRKVLGGVFPGVA